MDKVLKKQANEFLTYVSYIKEYNVVEAERIRKQMK
jgi:hypothetical protein